MDWYSSTRTISSPTNNGLRVPRGEDERRLYKVIPLYTGDVHVDDAVVFEATPSKKRDLRACSPG